jgi:hypothetical protein
MDWKKYFEMMIDWKKLPAYKAEPRIDSLIGYFLDSILSDFLKVEIEGVIPEFPLRLGTIYPEQEGTNYSDRSYKVDFLAVGNNGINYLVEFKTDTSSRVEKQDLYLQQSKSLGSQALLEGALIIADVSTYKNKYRHLKSKLQNTGMLGETFDYLLKNPKLEIVYVQPQNNNNDPYIISFEWIANWLEGIAEKDSFEVVFAATLRLWSKD